MLNALPANLSPTPAGSNPLTPQAAGVSSPFRMSCPSCKNYMCFAVAPVINCPSCGCKCLPPARQSDFTFKVEVPVEAGAGSGRPFGISLSSVRVNDPRRILIVPPVEVPVGATLTVAAGPELVEGDFGEHFDLEGIVLRIELPVGSVPATDLAQAVAQNTLQPTQTAPSETRSASDLLKRTAGATAGVALRAASAAVPSVVNTLAARPKTLVLRSNLHFLGPLALGMPQSGVEATMGTALGSSFPCGACGVLLKVNAKCKIFRCGNCGVLSSLPVSAKEKVLKVRLPPQTAAFIVLSPDTLPNAQDPLRPRQVRVLVRWPVTNIAETDATIAVMPAEQSFGDMMIHAAGVAFDALHWVANPLEAAFDAAVISPAAGPIVDSTRPPDVEGRLISTQ